MKWGGNIKMINFHFSHFVFADQTIVTWTEGALCKERVAPHQRRSKNNQIGQPVQEEIKLSSGFKEVGRVSKS